MKELNTRHLLPLTVVVALMFSCIRRDSPPPGILSKEEMARFMMQIYTGEARALTWPVSRDSAYKIFVPFEDSIMRSMGITDSVLVRSYRYYTEHPKEMEAIFDSMIDSLSLKEQRLRQAPPTIH